MHLMVGFICVAATLILHEGKPTYVSTTLELTLKRESRKLTGDLTQFLAQECHSEQGDHICISTMSVLREPGEGGVRARSKE